MSATRDDLVAAVSTTTAALTAASAAHGNGSPEANEAYRAWGVAFAALREHQDAEVAATEAARRAAAPARRTVRRSDGRVVRTVGRKGWTEY